MTFTYHPEIDVLEVRLREGPGADVHIVNDYVRIDVDEAGEPLVIEIENASERVELKNWNASSLPLESSAA